MQIDIIQVGRSIPALATGNYGLQVAWPASGPMVLFQLLPSPCSDLLGAADIEHGMRLAAYSTRNALVLAVQIGGLPWEDAPYNPHLHGTQDISATELLPGTGLLVCYAIVDSTDGRVLRMDPFVASHDFALFVWAERQRLCRAQFHLEQYYADVLDLYARHSPEDFARQSQSSFYLLPRKRKK